MNKKFIVLISVMLMVFAACASEGQQGAQGPAGEAGPAGPAGEVSQEVIEDTKNKDKGPAVPTD